ncbi:MAG: 30S ribosomal protein S21 [Bacteroidia bacterium]|jgi:small subunit ribosomal protein S21
MIFVNVKENESLDRALKKFKKKFEKTGVVKEMRERKEFTKPCVKNRFKRIRAAYKLHLQQEAQG